MASSETSEVLEELRIIKDDIQYIKENMVDVDMILTTDEAKLLADGIDEYKRGKTTKLDDLKRD